ncbi:MAG TPA: G8 domain-containing protein [Abditibacterium sp.]
MLDDLFHHNEAGHAARQVAPAVAPSTAAHTAHHGFKASAVTAPNTLPQDPSPLPRLGEHTALHHLLKYAEVTIYSVKSGGWGQAETWNLKRLPNANDRVCILSGHKVTVDETGNICLTCRIDGTLSFNTQKNTSLRVETLGNLGKLEIGTNVAPVAASRTTNISFRDTGPLDPVRDPLLQARGLISYGEVSIYGAETQPGASLVQGVKAGQSSLPLPGVSYNWRVGDSLLVPGTSATQNQDEHFKIKALQGAQVLLDRPAQFDHLPATSEVPQFTTAPPQGQPASPPALVYDPSRQQTIPVANLTRNVTLESENAGDIRRRAHVMLMGLSPVATCYAHFKNLGRTDKSRIIIDTPNSVGAQASNERARYAWHVHRMGVLPGTRAAVCIGCSASGSPGWGFVNHSSHAHIEKCVAFNCTGAGFATEVGNEFGHFKNCLSIRNAGSGAVGGEENPQRSEIYDFGHMGFGFWFQGMGCSIEGNTAFGAGAAGFGISNTNMNREWTPTYNTENFPIGNTPDPSIFDNPPYGSGVDVGRGETQRSNISFRFKNNTCAASTFGLESWRFGGQAELYPGVTRHIENLTVWGCLFPLFLNYSSDFSFVRGWLRGAGNDPQFGGWSGHELDGWMMIGDDNAVRRTFTDCRMEGFRIGLQWFPQHLKVVRGWMDNQTNFLVPSIPYTLDVSGTLFSPREGSVDFAVDRGRDSAPDTFVFFNGRRLFFRAQAPSGSVEATKGARLRGLFASRNTLRRTLGPLSPAGRTDSLQRLLARFRGPTG